MKSSTHFRVLRQAIVATPLLGLISLWHTGCELPESPPPSEYKSPEPLRETSTDPARSRSQVDGHSDASTPITLMNPPTGNSPPPCVPNYLAECVGSSVALIDRACDADPIIVNSCPAGCEDAQCLLKDDCEWEVTCPDGSDLYWVRSCGGEQMLHSRCDFGCDALTQAPECLADPCPDKFASKRCNGEDLMWVDECGVLGDRAETCDFGCDTIDGHDACLADPNAGVRTVTFLPSPVRRLCPHHIGGDRDFDGHGPRGQARVALTSSDTTLSADIYLHLVESKSDYTEADLDERRSLYEAPAGCTIRRLLTGATSSASYTDTDHSVDVLRPLAGGPVSRFRINADTGGNDVGNCTNDDSYLDVEFSEIEVELNCQ